ncbi:hypothetical protein [Planktosalinus lacus]|uniref:Cytochrome c n=1 Tax=Planktosalinus lacus TaxID=1526573 RepID=A0A8J2Y881_9FLAO|nr:hypothetical protein [Planktosalinus lacus]GGD91856.1 hypothetical protein GCM10011312_14580 [Planktosalinus lacus]
MSRFSFLLLIIACCSCQNDNEKALQNPGSDKGEKKYDLYEPSEMALLMNVMYDIQNQLKGSIQNGDSLSNFPEEILKIHTAQMSDFKERNQAFEAYSHLFVEKFELIFDTTSQVPLKKRYNDAVNLCLNCHQTECTGPIPRIKKLLIK